MTASIPEIYVLWHPMCRDGEALARRIYEWLRPGSGLGPEVFFRSLPAPDAPPGGLPPPLAGESRAGAPPSMAANRWQIVVLLIDAHMISDPAWRNWLHVLATRTGRGTRDLLPVALDDTAYNVPERLRALNFMRPTATAAAGIDGIVRSLLIQLTETLCRMLLTHFRPIPVRGAAGTGNEADRAKLTIFLSHAKADGTGPARRIRDYIYGKTQLAAFYDENDVPFGSGFSRVLQRAIAGDNTAALIAVRSARYADRPWCRREISSLRVPLADPVPGRLGRHWHLNPVLVVDALDGGAVTSGIPELGNAPVVRWSDEVSEQEERIVTMVLRDTMLTAFHRALGRTMPDDRASIVLDWVPDLATLLCIPEVRARRRALTVYYPGRGLSLLELNMLEDHFPRLTFRSFERAET